MTLTEILTAVGTVISSTITWASSFLAVFTTNNGWFTVFLLLGLSTFGIRMVWSLMHR